jgi:glucose/arabinose dehydrogenase
MNASPGLTKRACRRWMPNRVASRGAQTTDNPFAGKPGALPEIWSYGHRNMQDAALGPDGLIYLLTDQDRGKLIRLRPAVQP